MLGKVRLALAALKERGRQAKQLAALVKTRGRLHWRPSLALGGRFGLVPLAQQSGWIRLRQNLLGKFDGLPRALYHLAIILAGVKNLDYRAGFLGHGFSSRGELGARSTYLGQ